MGGFVILGCGYSGRVLARRLLARGLGVRATTTTETKLSAIARLGAEAVSVGLDDRAALAAALEDAEVVVHLAPPLESRGAREVVRDIRRSVSSRLRAYVYGSTTGVFGATHGDSGWVDETTPPGEVRPRALQRVEYERELGEAGLPLRILRIAGIYGPGRTLRDSIEREALLLFHGAPETSRIHVEDLARLLEAMTRPDAPSLALACDDLPATTLDVARYTSGLLGRHLPEPVAIEDARRLLSPVALEMRLGGHRCRSIHRSRLIGALEFPTYREGVRASLIAEGVALPEGRAARPA